MRLLRNLRNFFCYCGIEKDEYDAIKKEVYVSNYEAWRLLHIFMVCAFGFLFVASLVNELFRSNMVFYLIAFIYCAAVSFAFRFFKKDSIIIRLIIYLSISGLFLFGCLITQNKPGTPATMFIALLLIAPILVIDKPFIMAIEIGAAAAVFLVWMYKVKPFDVWKYDLSNIIIFSIVGIFIHVLANSIRIREFVLTRKINIQKDTDELTGLKNKGALTGEINSFLVDGSSKRGVIFIIDVDGFKEINDTYGHDEGDKVIRQIGSVLNDSFKNGETVGRFGGDEFIIFIKYVDGEDDVRAAAQRIIDETAQRVKLPDEEKKVKVSIGVAIYHGLERNYSEIFKKADTALYEAKADKARGYVVYK